MTEDKKIANMKLATNGWKVTAIIFIVLFSLQVLVTILGLVLIQIEEDKIDECYYDICEGYADALFYEDVCYCYNTDDEVVKTENMK